MVLHFCIDTCTSNVYPRLSHVIKYKSNRLLFSCTFWTTGHNKVFQNIKQWKWNSRALTSDDNLVWIKGDNSVKTHLI
jgi:hypothetical protein